MRAYMLSLAGVLAGAKLLAGPTNLPWTQESIFALSATNPVVVSPLFTVDPEVGELAAQPLPHAHINDRETVFYPVPPATAGSKDLAELARDELHAVARTREQLESAEQLFAMGSDEEAFDLLQSAVAQTSNRHARAMALSALGIQHFRHHNYGHAAGNLARASSLQPDDPAYALNYAVVLSRMQRPGEAARILEDIDANALGDTELKSAVYFNRACAEALLGQADQAISNLAQAARYAPAGTLAALDDPRLEAIHRDPRFASLQAHISNVVEHAAGAAK